MLLIMPKKMKSHFDRMVPCPKKKPYRSPKYLKFRRERGRCEVCGQPSEPHHVRRYYWGAGASQKPHDFVTVDRCREHHKPEYEYRVNEEIVENLVLYLTLHKKERELIEHLMVCCKENKL